MVRVGGGWDTLENYLTTHDPCRVALFRKAGGPADMLNVKSPDGTVVEKGYKSQQPQSEERSFSLFVCVCVCACVRACVCVCTHSVVHLPLIKLVVGSQKSGKHLSLAFTCINMVFPFIVLMRVIIRE